VIEIDGSHGEGGGQVLRTALGLSLVTGTPFRIESIRARRKKPGVLRQHLCAIRAAAEVGDAELEGDALGSMALTFRPRSIRPGKHSFSIGSAGSTSLVLQTILPALLVASAPSSVTIEGGTHNPMAPPFEFLAGAFAPLLGRMGVGLTLTLARHGFAPAGGGRLDAEVRPGPLSPLTLLDRGALISRRARALVASVPFHVAERELAILAQELGLSDHELQPETLRNVGPGNVVDVTLEHEHVTEVFVGFGERGVPAERVARSVAREVRGYLSTPAPVGSHLADQLLIPLALAGGGVFRTVEPTEHTRTQAELVQRFLDVAIEITGEPGGTHRIEVRKR
jgi:RNA 3'-terminal phosphate cyclase (ATP)